MSVASGWKKKNMWLDITCWSTVGDIDFKTCIALFCHIRVYMKASYVRNSILNSEDSVTPTGIVIIRFWFVQVSAMDWKVGDRKDTKYFMCIVCR